MVGDGVGDVLALMLFEGVVAAHHALQLGEFAHHQAGQVRLGEGCGPLRCRRVRPHLRRDLGGESGHPLHFFRHRAELGVEHDLFERRDAGFELHLAVLVPEELGVREARAQDALVA